MGVRYPDQVGGHKPCVPGFDLILREGPRVDRATMVVVVCRGRHGATHDLAQRGVSRSGRQSVMAVGRFSRNAVVHPNGSARPWVP